MNERLIPGGARMMMIKVMIWACAAKVVSREFINNITQKS
jgi:hypothetical protein